MAASTGHRYCLILLLLFWVTDSAADEFPYELKTGRELAILAPSIALFGLGYLKEANTRPLIPEEIDALDANQINTFDRTATIRWSPGAAQASDYLSYTTLGAPVSLMFTTRGSDKPGTLGLMYLETMLLNGGLTYSMKTLFSRTRPYVYNDDLAIPADAKQNLFARRSFPSGHTSNAFASMVFLATVYSQLYPDSAARDWVWGGCLVTASVTGYLRYAAGKHFPTDILAGAALGAFCGWLVPHLHEIDTSDSPVQDPRQQMLVGLTFGF